MYLTEKEEILHLKDKNKELKDQIKKMNDYMNDLHKRIILLKADLICICKKGQHHE